MTPLDTPDSKRAIAELTQRALEQPEFKGNQAELARVAGVSKATINRMLGRDKNWQGSSKFENVVKVARAGKVQIPDFLRPEDLEREPIIQPAGFGEAQVAPVDHDAGEILSPNQSVWTVQTSDLSALGMLRGDKFILDMARTPVDGDRVVANIYDTDTGSAVSVIRIFYHPFLHDPTPTSRHKRDYIDSEKVQVKGVIIRSWRDY